MSNRFDRRKLLIGTYCLQSYARTEAHVQALADAHIDFICAVPWDPALLDLCQKHGIGLFAQYLPSWGGWLGENAGTMAEKIPLAEYERCAAEFRDHPAIWALDIGDEPSALDLPHMGRLAEAVQRLFPRMTTYTNLYPNYGAIPENTPEDVVRQLGVAQYADYIDKYIECVDTDYICFDYYMYDTNIFRAYENMALVADKCRASGRDMWVVLQVNSKDPAVWQSENRLRHQAYTAMAFGARAINWACWTAGWWHNNVLDANGAPTQQYEKLRAVNAEIKAMGEKYMRYRNFSTRRFSGGSVEKVGGLANFYSKSDLFIGEMADESGCHALMMANINDPYDVSPAVGTVRFDYEGELSALCCGKPLPLRQDGNTYEFEIGSSEGVLLMLED